MNKFEINHAEAVLIASHIKPWKDSDENERLDIDNGLLLCPNHDKAFDRGYISFDDNGLIITTIQYNDEIKLTCNKEIIKIDDTHYTIGD